MATIEITVGGIGHVRSLADIERDVIAFALQYYGDKTEAARRLGIGRSTLYRKLETDTEHA